MPDNIKPWFYRTSAGAEIDLVLEKNSREILAIEVKRSMSPSVTKGFHLGSEDINASAQFIVYPGKEAFKVTKTVEAISLEDMMDIVRKFDLAENLIQACVIIAV